MEIAVFPPARYGLVQPRGVVHGDRIVSLALALAAHDDWRPGFAEVWDVRFTEAVDIVPADVQRVLALERRTKKALAGSPTVLVVSRPLVVTAAELYARLVRPLGRCVVVARTGAEAAEVLGVDALPDLGAG